MEKIIEEADAFKAKDDVHANYNLLNKAFESGSQEPEISWRLARGCYDMGCEATDKAEKQQFFERGVALAKAAVEAQPENFAPHKWTGILLGSLGDFLPTKEKIANAYIIRDHFKKGCELKPEDSTLQHCMGKWCWNVLQIGWIERQAASLLFGTPPASTYEECEQYLLASAKYDAKQVHNNLLLGDLYYQQKRWEDAKTWYKHAIDCAAVTQHQQRLKQEAEKKLTYC